MPKPGTAQGALPATAGQATRLVAGSLPVWIGKAAGGRGSAAQAGPAGAQVQVLGQDAARKAGVQGVLLAVRGVGGTPGGVGLKLDYRGFRHLYGGDWASRLNLRQLPACALTTPGTKGCGTGTLIRAANDPKAGTLSAAVRLAKVEPKPARGERAAAPVTGTRSAVTGFAAEEGTVLLAVTSAASGATGDFTATTPSASGGWTAGGSTGAFTWSYDLAFPEVPSELDPELNLSYSSQSVDGRTASTNNQANWIGDGWSMEAGSITRQYVACDDDKTDGNNSALKVGDQCWKTDNATVTLNGSTQELVRDDATKQWRLKDDDGTKVEKLADTQRGNGDDNGEYWRLTTPDGTRFYFGYNRLPGWASGKEETGSTWTAPVFGNQSGEPCHAATFAASWCQQAWRWNLDYVEDPSGNAMAYFWEKETNRYGLNVNADTGKGTDTTYVRGGYLKRIDYGLRSDAVYAANGAAAVAEFGVSERCLTDCGTFDKAHAANWPDVPFDQYCTTAAACTSYSPSFWTRKRLTSITTKVLVGSAYEKVDSWALTHQFPSPGDGTDPALWLASITRTGHGAATPVTLPPVTFQGQQLKNRVDGAVTDPVPPLVRYRVYGIETETGSTVGVTYSAEDCSAADLPSPSTNTRRCYPVVWSPPDAPAPDYKPYQDWFHSYEVKEVLESDNVGGAPVKTTSFSYLDGLSWGKDDDELTKSEERTYNKRRGYGRVQERVGAGSDARTLTEHRYFRGIDGAQVADGEGNTAADHEAFAGMTREEATYDKDGGRIVDAAASTPWRSAATATHARPGLPDQVAYRVGTASETTRELKADGGWRRAKVTNTFDSIGQVIAVSDSGDLAASGDERCVTTSYARNTAANMLDYVSEVRTVAKGCGDDPDLPRDLISVERTYYDGSGTLGAAPTKGDATRKDEQDGEGTGYITTETSTYDRYGRPLTSTDASGTTTTTAYTPATGAAPTRTTVTNALGHTHTVLEDPRRGAPVAEIDANGRRSDAELDALGRVVRVWEQGWPKADHADQPSAQYTYTVAKTSPTVVAAKTIQHDGSYRSAYTIYDGLLRERESQVPAIGGGRIVSETLYDTRGFAWKTYNGYYTSGNPSGTLVKASDNTIPNMTENVHDGLGQVVAAISRKYGEETRRTTTAYSADRVTVTPPRGGIKQTTVTDARDRVVELLQYTDPAAGTAQKTTYGYEKHDQLATMTDPAGNTWTNTYDARGRKITAKDPDKGTARFTYDDTDQPVTVTDARGVTLTTSYDDLGRKTALKQGSIVRATWTYDTLLKGELSSSARIDHGETYTTTIGGYNDRDQPTSLTMTIPVGGGTESYAYSYGYNTYTGQREWVLRPAAGGLPSERVTTVYGEGGLPSRTTAGQTIVVGGTVYDSYGRIQRTEHGSLGSKAYRTLDYDEHTGDLVQQIIDRDTAPQRVDDTSYRRDPAGNITSIATVSGSGDGQVTDRQCFKMDALRRLTEAWTTTAGACQEEGPSASVVGGTEGYWHSYEYDAVSNRKKETRHAVPGTATTEDTVRTYTLPAGGADRPHAVTAVDNQGGAADGTRDAFGYDVAGNMTDRKAGNREQSLTWDPEGRLASVTEAGKTTRYVYDENGERLLTLGPDGARTLYLPEGDELTTGSNGAESLTRYYSHGGGTVAVRTAAGLFHTFSDHQGTSLTAVRAGDGQGVIRRRQLPFGGDRTERPTGWPGTRGFVGGVEEPTGLTHLGARDYDPALGSFLSVDPLIDPQDPAQTNAYAYGAGSPVTFSDPDGLRPIGPTDRGYLSGGDADYDRKRRQKSRWTYSRKRGWGYVVTKHHSTYSYGRPSNGRRYVYRRSLSVTYWSKGGTSVSYSGSWARQKAQQRAAAKKRQKSNTIWGKIKSGAGKAKKVGAKAKDIGADAGKAIGRGAENAGKWVWKNRSTIVTVGATVSCIAPGVGWATCVAAQSFAYGVRSSERIYEQGFDASLEDNAVDMVFTISSLKITTAMEYAKFGQLSRWRRPPHIQNLAPPIYRPSGWQMRGPNATGVGAWHGVYTLTNAVPAGLNAFRNYG
ncbi:MULTISPECIES: RHS repeat domain-containing protein [Actinomadura]|uniref:RHS repeat protein n=1 Tax=Actinomadura geliboluensis TaxID=882440 RepID=A0A5S4HAU3_9ACTN|nr:RHS repeat-associated core domain-containing protein [Actinomadura geliboluensis]TMR42375.1 RHS repeat protein [Actinomadura geliboluensis]